MCSLRSSLPQCSAVRSASPTSSSPKLGSEDERRVVHAVLSADCQFPWVNRQAQAFLVRALPESGDVRCLYARDADVPREKPVRTAEHCEWCLRLLLSKLVKERVHKARDVGHQFGRLNPKFVHPEPEFTVDGFPTNHGPVLVDTACLDDLAQR